MLFQPSSAMKISLLPEQEKQLSSKEKIEAACTKGNVLAFDILLLLTKFQFSEVS